MNFFHRLFKASTHNKVSDGFQYPVVLQSETIPTLLLRPLTSCDQSEWNNLRFSNKQWLHPWESTDPLKRQGLGYRQWLKENNNLSQSGQLIIFAIVLNGRIIGEISLGGIVYGSIRTAIIGYWIDEKMAGHGIVPQAVSMVADWAFYSKQGPHLHRLEAALIPSNTNSRIVVQKVGFTKEGIHRKYMHVNGCWRDHESWVLLSDDYPDGVERTFNHREK